MKIRVYTFVKPTEDINKVRRAIENIYTGELVVTEEDRDYYRIEGLSFDINSLNKLRDLIRIKQIIPATRNYLFRKISGNSISILLHKQAAYMRNISFIDSDKESPLGAILIEIEANNIEEVINWLAPKHYTSSQNRVSRSRE